MLIQPFMAADLPSLTVYTSLDIVSDVVPVDYTPAYTYPLRKIIVKAFLTALYVSLLVLMFAAEQPAPSQLAQQQLNVITQSPSRQ